MSFPIITGVHLRSLVSGFLLVALVSAVLSSCGEEQLTVEGKDVPMRIDYNLHVRPILSDRCFFCHGPDAAKREADLRLDTPEGAYAALASGMRAIVPGKPGKSELYHRITTEDSRLLMPPASSNLALSKYEIAVLKRWIDQGAEYKPFPNFVQPVKASLPQTKTADWGNNEIDRFILAAMEQKGLKPSPEAEKYQLLRRLCTDLTGLPPDSATYTKFISDTSAGAYENLVSDLLNSVDYAERMALDWLDVARYADSKGYQDDGYLFAWPYRDWLIRAFQQNLSFKDFIKWQIAGDLLPKATYEQKLATAFNRIHMQNEEGGIVDEEYRVEYVLDRTNTVSKGLLGLTMECARCHDHKYDPISQKEYFAFSAFFNQVDEPGQFPHLPASGPTIYYASQDTIRVIDSLDNRQQQLLSYIRKLETENKSKTGISGEAAPIIDLDFSRLQKDKIPAGKGNFALFNQALTADELKQHHLLFDGNKDISLGTVGDFDTYDEFAFRLTIQIDTPSVKELPVFSKMRDVFKSFVGYDLVLDSLQLVFRMSASWPYNALVLKTGNLPLGVPIDLAISYDGTGQARGVSIFVDNKKIKTKTEKDNLLGSIKSGEKYKLMIGGFSGVPSFIGSTRLSGVQISSFKIYAQHLDAQKAVLAQTNMQYAAYKNELKALKKFSFDYTRALPEIMVMQDRLHKRPTYLLERGLYDAHGEEVQAGTPQAILPFDASYPQNRLGLARWLTSPHNPLVARVIVNRYWQMLFGRGLVATSDDFGSQGALPSHPELLDWLAVDFVESGWDVKQLMKKMVMSATYRQSAKISPEHLTIDPSNVYLARGPRFRMSAEMVRDRALAVSGLLVKKVGGPSVKPYQPAGLWEEKTSGRYLATYEQDHGEALYRKSMYTFIKRTSPPPLMGTFDGPERSYCTVKRQATNTPLQALLTLNDPQMVEAARITAQKMLEKNIPTAEARINYLYQKIVFRSPSAKEQKLLANLVTEEQQRFTRNPGKAAALIAVGEYEINKKLNPIDLATWTVAVNTLFNLDETLTKE